jgi:hypothetical protein
LDVVVKPIRIGFVEDKTWIIAYASVALSCLVIVGAEGWRWHQDQLTIEALDAEIAQAKKRAIELQAKANAPDPHRAEKEAIQKLLQMDLNKVFSAVENLNEPGVRLRSMDLDAAGNSLRLEYELDSIQHAVTVTADLNAGYAHGPWHLESVSGSGALQPGVPAQKFRGLWSAAVDRL